VQYVVVVDSREPDHGHHRVADELLDLPPWRVIDALIASK
jgi:hypothetical protein